MENVSIDELTKLYTFEELNTLDKDLELINKELNKQTNLLEHPNSFIQRIFFDAFGTAVLYCFLFFTCDITQAIINDRPLFGLEWLFFGPYYFFTGAPILTRVWKSKKFLEDLTELKTGGLEYPPDSTCTEVGTHYTNSCTSHEQHPHRHHPLRNKLGRGIDWIIRHSIGKHLGGVLGSFNCTDQGSTIAKDCAYDRCLAIWNAYNLFCDQYDVIINRATDMNWPNERPWTGNMLNNAPFSSWNDHEKAAYQCYYDSYIKIYQIGSTAVGDDGVPHDLMPDYDHDNYYSFNVAVLFHSSRIELYNPIYLNTFFGVPVWWTNETNPIPESDMESFIRYFQLHIAEHTLDYWDTS